VKKLKKTLSTLSGDLDGDGKTDESDIFLFSQWWDTPRNETNYRCHFDEDTFVDDKDLLEFLRIWGGARN